MKLQKMTNSSQVNSIALAKKIADYRENMGKMNQQMIYSKGLQIIEFAINLKLFK